MKDLSQDLIKKAVGEKAASMIEEGMLVGLGTGSTATFFIESLIKRCQSGLKISAVATSERSYVMGKKGGIYMLDATRVTHLDITVDGADEIDPQNRMIKGGGGALVREKILASSSQKMLVVVDESKLVNTLGKFGLPVEIISFCYLTTLAKIRKAGFDGKLRETQGGSHYVTDNGNYIFDIQKPDQFDSPQNVHQKLMQLPGVVDTGLFFDLPVELLVGYNNGTIMFRERKV